MKNINLTLIVLLSFGSFNAQINLDAEKLSSVIFRLYLDNEIDSIINNYLPDENLWEQLRTESNLNLRDYKRSCVSIKDWLNEEITDSETIFEDFIIDSIETIKSDQILKINEETYLVVESIIDFSSGEQSFIGYVTLFELNGAFRLFPKGGIKYEHINTGQNEN